MSSATSKSTSQKDAPRRLFGDAAAAAAAPKQTSNNTVQEEDNEVSSVTPTTTPRKRTRQTFLSPEKKSKSDSAFVTPSKNSRVDKEYPTEEKKEAYVPTYIHQNIDYKRRGQGKINDTTQKSFDLVEQHFILPKDLEANRKYGPISGSTFEQHAIRAYSLGMLKAKSQSNPTTEICTACANQGHTRDGCPKLV